MKYYVVKALKKGFKYLCIELQVWRKTFAFLIVYSPTDQLFNCPFQVY